MSRLSLLCLLGVLLATDLAAQMPTGDCEPGVAYGELESSFLRARVFNGGNLFYRPPSQTPGLTTQSQYVVPAGSGQSPMYAATLLVGGMVANELRTAAATYGDFDFWPGPLDEEGRPPSDCGAYDRIYTIDRADLEHASCPIDPQSDLALWPAELGAPVIDGDGNPDNYDVAGGDRPALLGDEMAFWVMNDRGNTHGAGGTLPIGMEVRSSAFIFGDVDDGHWASPAAYALRSSTLYRFELHYRGEQPLIDAYVGLYADADLGGAGDDLAGTDTTLDLVYTYNREPSDAIYGSPPPAVGVAVLRGPNDEQGLPLGLEAAPLIWKAGPFPYGEPHVPEHFYYNLQGLYHNGDTMRAGGYGRASDGEKLLFQFPGDPVAGTYWSELNADGQGTANQGGDRRMMASSGPFDMQPGDVAVFEFAIITAFGSDHLDSITELRSLTERIRGAREELYEPTRVDPVGPCPSTGSDTSPINYVRNHPDPATDLTRFEYSLAAPTHVRLRVFDPLGREVATLVDETQQPGPHGTWYDVSQLSSGVYYARFELLDVENARPVTVTDSFTIVR